MKSKTSYLSFFAWLCIFASIPAILVFCFTDEITNYKTAIPWIVISIALIPFALAFSIHKDLASVNELEGLTNSETARLKLITLKARKFVVACVVVLFIIVALVVAAFIMISTIKANYLYTAIAGLSGAELFVIKTLLLLQSNLGDFRANIIIRKRDLETRKRQKEKLMGTLKNNE